MNHPAIIGSLALLLCTSAPALGGPDPGHARSKHTSRSVAPLVEQGSGHAPCVDGVAAGFPCRNVDLLSRLTPADLGGATALDHWGWKDPDTGRYYALVGLDNGTSFVDVTDPETPLYVGRLPSAGSTVTSSGWRDLKTYRNHVFIVADAIQDHGMQVFDLERLRGVVEPQVFDADAHYGLVGDAHNIAIDEDSGYAIIVGSDDCNGGLHLVDIRDPELPEKAGCFGDDGNTHDVQCVTYRGPDPDYHDAEICFASNRDSLTIVDVSDKSATAMTGKAGYPNAGFAHQGWLNRDQRYFLLGDELDERDFGSNTRTLVFDVQDLDNPFYVGSYLASTGSIDHNLYVVGDFVYQANYTAGLRILQIDDLAAAEMHEVAYFDTFPTSDDRGFDGAWNVFPFFDNGTLLVSDMDAGLFVLRATLPGSGLAFDGGMSGAWIAAGLNDQGLTLLVDENIHGPVVFAAWFLYLGGEPFWLAGSAQFEAGAATIRVPVQRLEGLGFLLPGEDRAERIDLGDLTIHALACDRIRVEYDLAEGLGAGALTMRPVIGVQGRGCSAAD